MMDGISAVDTGNNGQMVNMNIESIGEIKVLTQGYQAEYGRSSGLQITAVTKSGTNQFHGSGYSVFTDSDWNKNSWVSQKNGDAKSKSSQQTYGYTIGGPVRIPKVFDGRNKLFFFYAHEFVPQIVTTSGSPIRYRLPSALERAGNFSQSRDNNGALLPAADRLSERRALPEPDYSDRPAVCPWRGGAQPLSAPDPGASSRGRTTTTRRMGSSYSQLTQQPAVKIDYQLNRKSCASRESTRGSGSERSRYRACFRASTMPTRRIPTSPTLPSRLTT